MKQRMEDVIKKRKVIMAIMEIILIIACSISLWIMTIPKDKFLSSTYSYSKVERYEIKGDHITRVMPQTEYETFIKIVKNTLKDTVGEEFTLKIYEDKEKKNEITKGYIKTGMVAEITYEDKEKSVEKNVVGTEKISESQVKESINESVENSVNKVNNTDEDILDKQESEESTTKEVDYIISVIGDLTGNGDMSVTELTRIVRGVVKLKNWDFKEEEKLIVDLNGDGQIDVTDVECCINYIVFGEFEVVKKDVASPSIEVKGDKDKTNECYTSDVLVNIIENEPKENIEETKTSVEMTFSDTGETKIVETTENTFKLSRNGIYTITSQTYSKYGNKSDIVTKTIKINKAQKTDVSYKVEHYKEELDGSYTLTETENLAGTTGSKVTATAKEYTGFTEDSDNENRVAEGTIVEDGSLTLKLYYTRNEYTLTLDKDENIENITGAGTYKYGASVSINAILKEEIGYDIKWNKWVSENTEIIADNETQNATIEMPAGEVTLTATTTKEAKTDVAYKVEHYKEELDGSYTLVETENLAGTTGSKVTATAKEYTGFTEDSDNENRVAEGTILEDESLTLKLYYTRNEYTLTLDKDENIENITGAGTYKYGATVSINATLKEEMGYEIRWNKWISANPEIIADNETQNATIEMPAGEVTLTATTTKEAKTDVAYKVEHYKEELDGSYTLVETENLAGTTGSRVTAIVKEYAGFTEDSDNENRVAEGTIEGDGSLTLKLYYTRNQYEIIFKDYDGRIITEKEYKYEQTVEIPENPTRESNETYTYEFIGWSPEVTQTATQSEEYIAMYKETYIEYTVTFKQYDGNNLYQFTYHYGDTIVLPENPTRESTISHAYEFVGWSPEVAQTVTQNLEYIATYEEKDINYTLIFNNYDGTEIKRIENYHYGDTFSFPENPTREPTEEIKYEFSGWKSGGTEEINKAEVNMIFIAEYTEKYFVARVVETDELEGASYLTLEEAVESVAGEERTIKMLQDTEETIMIEDDQNITLDLNGKTITGSRTTTKGYAIKNYGKLTITDTTEEKAGKIKEIANTLIGYGIHNRDGEILIEAGTIVTETSQAKGVTYGIYNQSTKPVTVTGGSVIAEARGENSTSCGIYNLAGEMVQVTGGMILANANADSSTSYGVYNKTNGVISVTGGSVQSKSSLASAVSYGIYNETSRDVVLNGGTISTQSDRNIAYGVYNKTGKISVTNGNIEVNATQGYGVYNEASTAETDIQNGKVTMVGTTSYGIYNKEGVLSVSGGTIELLGATSYGIYNYTGTANITGGEIIAKATGSSIYGIYNENSDSTIISGITINAQNGRGIYNKGGTLQIESADITASTGIYNYYLSTNDIGTVVIKSANITAISYGIENNYGRTEIQSANINSNNYGVYNSNSGDVIIGTKDGQISTIIPSIKGTQYGIYQSPTTSGKIYYYDGTIIGKMAIYGGVSEIEDNSEIVIEQDSENNEKATLREIETQYVAEIGETKYASLMSAVNDIVENVQEGTTIEIIADFDISEGVEIPENKSVIIDLAGYTVTTYGKGGITNKGNLELTDSSAEETGIIKSQIGIGISNEGNLVISKGTVDSNGYGIYNYNDGSVLIQGGLLKGKDTVVYNKDYNSTINMKGGKINTNNGIGIYVNQGTVDITGGNITAESCGIHNENGNLNVTGGEIEASNSWGIYSYGTSNVSGGNITSESSSGIANSSSGRSFTIEGGTIKGKNGITNSGVLTIGKKDKLVDSNNPTIIGTEYGLETAININTNIIPNVKYYDGVIYGEKGAIHGSINELKDGKEIQNTQEILDEKQYQVARLVDETVNEDGIAQIGDSVYKTVSSLKQAINQVEPNTEEPVEVTILNDFKATQEIVIANNQNVRINLNGKTITVKSNIVNEGNLEITDTSEDNNGKIIGDVTAIYNRKNLTITRGTIEGITYGIYSYYGNIVIGTKDENVNDTDVTIIGNTYGIKNYNSTKIIKMYDGIVKGINASESYVSETEKGYTTYTYTDGKYQVLALKIEAPAARIGEEDYSTLQEAIDASTLGDTIEILRDIEEKQTVEIANDKNIILDLKGYTVKSSSEKTLINNGTLKIANSSGTIYNEASNGISVENNGQIELVKGTIKSYRNIAVQNNGTLEVKGGMVLGDIYGIYNGEGGTLTFTSGTISAGEYSIYNNSTNTINISGGSITLNWLYNQKQYWYGIYNNAEANINITGGSIISTNYGNYVYFYGIYNNSNGNILIQKTDGISVNRGYSYGIYNNGEGKVTLENGTIEAKAEYLSYGIRNVAKGDIEVKNGNIKSISSNGYAYGIENGSLGKLKVTEGNITAETTKGASYGIKNISISMLNIEGGNITAKGTQSYGIYNNTSDLTIGVNDETISNSKPLITSDNIGIFIHEASAKFNFYDGKIIAEKTTLSEVNTPEGYKLLKYYDDSTQKEIAILSEPDKYVLTYYLNEEKYKSVILRKGDAIAEEVVEKEGYDFEGWQNLPTKMPEEDISINGVLTPKTYTLTYYVDGEVYGEVEHIKYKEGITAREVPSKEGYEFSGWSEIPNTMPASNVEVKGYFTYTATFYAEDGETILGTDKFTVEDTQLTEPEIPYKESYVGMWSAYEIKAEDISIQALYIKESELENAVAINATKGRAYDTLQSAITAVSTDSIENTIRLIKDTNESTTTTSGQNIVLDLNGHTISVSETGTTDANGIINNGTLTINDFSEEGNGSIEVTNESGEAKGIYNYGTLTIEGGNIESTSETGEATGINQNYMGTISVTGGNIKAISKKIKSDNIPSACGISNSRGEINVTGGNIEATNLREAAGIYQHYMGTINVTGGNITGTSISDRAYGIYNGWTYGGTINVTGGNIEATSESSKTFGIISNGGNVRIQGGNIRAEGLSSKSPNNNAYGIYSMNLETVCVSGGNIEVTSNSGCSYGICNDRGTLNVTGGSIDVTSEANATYGIYNESTGTVNVTGGNIDVTSVSDITYGIYNKSTGTASVTGGSIAVSSESKDAYGIYNESTGTVSVEAGKITITSQTAKAYGIYNSSTGTVTVSGGSIEADEEVISNRSSGIVTISGGILTSNSESYAVYNNSGEINMTGGEIIATNGTGIYNYNDGKINIQGGNIKAAESGITNYGNVAMTGGKIIAGNGISESSYYINGITNYKNVNLGIKDGIINLEEPIILSGTCGIRNDQYSDTVFNYYEGQILAKENTIEGTITEIEEGSQLKEETADIEGEQYKKLTLTQEIQYQESIALINGEGDYRTVSNLIEAINNIDSGEITEIKILQDIQLPIKGLEIGNNQNIILDLNGKEIKILFGKITNNGTLTIKDTTIDESGIINSQSGCAIYNNSNLIIENGDINSINHSRNYTYGIYNNGNITMKKGTITTKNITFPAFGIFNNRGTLNILGGNILSDGYGIDNVYNNGTVITLGIKDDTINLKEPKILGGVYGISNDGATLKYYDGQILGSEAIYERSLIEIQEGTQIKEEIEEIEGKQYKKISLTDETEYEGSIAFINNEGYYRTVNSLIKAINEIDTQETIEVKLLQNISPNGLEIKENKNIALDLNGNEIKFTYGKLTNNGKLTIKDTSEERNGTIDSESGYVICNDAELTIEEGNIVSNTQEYISSTIAILNNSNGRLNITGGSIIATGQDEHSTVYGIKNNGSAIITGGSITANGKWGYGIDNEGTMTVGVKDGVVNAEEPRINGIWYGICNTATLNYYDGKVSGEKSFNTDENEVKKVNEIESGYFIKTTKDDENEKEISYLGIDNGDQVQSTDEQGITWNYTYQDGKATNVYYESGELPEELRIPSTLDIYPVVSLYNSSEEASIFVKAENPENYANARRSVEEYWLNLNVDSNIPMKKIIIPDTVTEIGAHAFEVCLNLTETEMPNSVTKIGEYAFFGCKNLASIKIPRQVTKIGDYTFAGCKKIESITLNEGMTEIGKGSFYNCESLINIDIPRGVTSIEENTFENCSGLIKVDMPEGIINIGNNAFRKCSSLTSINMPETVKSIGAQAFEYCSSLTSIDISEGITSIGNYAFYNCSSLTNIEIPNSVTSIRSSAFFGCSSLLSIEIPESITEIYGFTFSNCSSLTDIYINNLESNVQIDSDWKTDCYAYVHYSDCTHNIGTIINEEGLNIEEVSNNLVDGEITCGEEYKFKILDNNGQVVTNRRVKVISEGQFTNSQEVIDIIQPDAEGIYTIENVKRNKILSIGIKNGSKYSATDSNGITWNYTYQDGKATNVYYESGELSEKVTIPSILDGYQVESLYNSVCNGNIFVKEDSYLNNTVKEVIIPDSVVNIGDYAFYSCSSLTDININNLESDVEFGSDWKYNCYAYVHYSDCTHTIEKWIEGDSTIQEESNNLNDGKIACGESYRFKLVDKDGNVLTNKEVLLKTQGQFTNSEEVTENIQPDAEGIYTIENVKRNKIISVGMKNGDELQATDSNGITWNYTFQDGKATNVYYESGELGEKVTIPSTLDGYQVESLYNGSGYGRNIFAKEDWSSDNVVKEVIMPNSATSIGNYAFYNCRSLTSVEIPGGVTRIGDWAFEYCSSLTSIEIPEGVTSIGYYAFGGCSSLTSIEIPNGVTRIGDWTFEYCSSLTSIEIPSSVTSIGNYAFYNCRSLTSVEIPGGVTSIGNSAFYSCNNLTDIYIGNIENNISFGSDWKYNCNAYVHYNDCTHNISINNEEVTVEPIETNTTQDGNVECRGTYKFKVLDNQGEVVKNKYAKIVSQGRFTNSQNREYWILSDENGIYTIENINRDIAIEDISDIQNGMTFKKEEQNGTIWNYTYQDGEATNVYYEEGTLTEQVEIPSTLDGYNVTSVGNPEIYGNIFKKFSGEENTMVKSVIIPDTVKRIENHAFYKCTGLQNVKLSEQLEIIGNLAFGDCDSLTNINIPSSVKTIGSLALDCDNLTDIYINNTKANINLQARWCPAITYVHYSDCKHNITKQIYTRDEMEIQTVDTELADEQIDCKANYQFKLVDKSGNIVTDEKVIVQKEGAFKTSKKVETEILPNEEGIYTIENIERNYNIIVGKEYQTTDDQGITWSYRCKAGKAIDVYYVSGDLPEELTIPSVLDGYEVVNLYNSSEEASMFIKIDEEEYERLIRRVLDNGEYNSDIPIKKIIIPETVTEIGPHAFELCSELTEIEIPNSVTKIGEYAFFGCKKLTDIKMPSQVTSVEDYTFAGCKNIETITLEGKITDIGKRAFYGCESLSDVYINNSESNIKFSDEWNIGSNAYVHYNNCNHEVKINNYSKRDITVEIVTDNIEEGKISCDGTYQFRILDGNNQVVTDEEVNMKTKGKFTNSDYESEDISKDDNGVYTIKNIKRDKIVTIGQENYQAIDSQGITWNYTYQDGKAINVYYVSGNLPSQLAIPSTLDGYPVTKLYNSSKDANIFANLESDQDYKQLINSVINGWNNRDSNITFESIVIPDTVTEIGPHAFEISSKLTQIEIPSSVTKVGEYAFLGCKKLSDIYINNNEAEITFGSQWNMATNAYVHYSDCTHEVKVNNYSKKNITIEILTDNLEEGKASCKENYQFRILDENNQVVTDEEVNMKTKGEFTNSGYETQDISADANGIYTIENIQRDKIVTIGQENNKATDDQGITWNYTYENGKAINVYYDSGDLPEELTIPDTLDGYPVVSLYNSSEEASILPNITIRSINIPNTVTTIGDYTFTGCNQLQTINIPDSVTTIGKYAFYRCSSLTEIDIPNNVESINDCTFSGCIKLKHVGLSRNIKSIGKEAFNNCPNLESFIIWNTVKEVGERAFGSWEDYQIINIESEEIPEGWSEIWKGNYSNVRVIFGYTDE